MPADTIRPQLRNLTTGKLHDLKRAWGVSMQALTERAYRLGAIRASERTNLYKTFSRLGWRTHEPVSDELTPEHPQLADHRLLWAQALSSCERPDQRCHNTGSGRGDKRDNCVAHPVDPRLGSDMLVVLFVVGDTPFFQSGDSPLVAYVFRS